MARKGHQEWFLVTYDAASNLLSSEKELQREDDIPRIAAVDSLGVIEGGASGRGVRADIRPVIQNDRVIHAVQETRNKLRMIQEVQELRAELQSESLIQVEVLQEI